MEIANINDDINEGINTEIDELLTNIKNIFQKHSSELGEEVINELRKKLSDELPKLKIEKNVNNKSKKVSSSTMKNGEENNNLDIDPKTNFQSKDEIEKLKLPDIKETLKLFGLKVGGKKDELVNRLWEHISSNKEFIPFFSTSENNRIKYGNLNDEWGNGVKYCGFDLNSIYYEPKYFMKLKKNKDDIEKNLFYNKNENTFISFFENTSEDEDSSNYISVFSLSKNSSGKSKKINFNLIEKENKDNIEDLFQNIDKFELIH